MGVFDKRNGGKEGPERSARVVRTATYEDAIGFALERTKVDAKDLLEVAWMNPKAAAAKLVSGAEAMMTVMETIAFVYGRTVAEVNADIAIATAADIDARAAEKQGEGE